MRLTAKFLAAAIAEPVCAATFPPKASSQDVPALLEATALVRNLSEQELLWLVPRQSGLRLWEAPIAAAAVKKGQLSWIARAA
jgi:hypothetical protein